MVQAEKTHFGFQQVDAEAKSPLVQGVFHSVAENYDLMNDLMSGGIHRLWKDAMIDWLRPRPGQKFIDVGGGTGDIAFRLLDAMSINMRKDHQLDETSGVTVCDITSSMLEVGRKRAEVHPRKSYWGQAELDWLCADAEKIPLEDNSIDGYTIAFCLRNVTRPDQALREAKRILKPGGRFMCLEFSQVIVPILSELYDLYSFKVLPHIGATVANDRASYQYLAESIRQFPPQEQLADMMRQAGFGQVKYQNLSGGIAALHSGWVL